MSLENEQIVATVPTVELANALRGLLMRRNHEGTGPRLAIYVFHNTQVPDEYHLGIASEWGMKVPEDVVLDTMIVISDFQEAQLQEEADFRSDEPQSVYDDLGLPPPPVLEENSDFTFGELDLGLPKEPVHEG
jgi:hypothetical protein